MARVNFALGCLIRKTAVTATLLGAILFAAVGCTGQSEILEVEVTREVPVTQEVPVTVETEKTVEVTREVRVAQEVPVTVTVPQTVEVTREVETLQMVEVTREVPVTRIVAATPAPTPEGVPTVAPDPPTPIPTAIPEPAIPAASATPTPTPTQASQFLSWEMEYAHYGEREIFLFQNTALEHTAGGPEPTIIYWCDTRSGRAMYINWHQPITATASNIPSSSNDPFSQYRDIPLYALLEYADDILEFVDDLQLSDREQREADEIWDRVTDRWFIGSATPPALANDPTPSDLVDLLDNRTHRSVDINLDFFDEIIDPEKRSPHDLPPLDTISGTWLVLSDRTQINQGSLGQLRGTIRRVYSPQFATAGTRPVMTATIKGPDQPAVTVAKWDIAGIRQVLSHCQAIRQ